ncbi:MAG: transmembrane anchor protein [Rhodospirillaceae bacterium BRH_c57]|nr:MAG: transmembrane anchor protein [Rhodospirillaceae bacterium BRH_c57]
MNNAHQPRIEDLPSPAKLFRSVIIAGVSAVAILVAVVLPAEYAIDPTGVGRVLGMTEMGEIKRELATEAERDLGVHGGDQSSSMLDAIFGLVVGTAHAQEAWRDEVSFTLAPGASAEIKLVMEAGAAAEYTWVATGGRINFDLHAHGGGQSVDYDRGRGATASEGTIKAGFAGEHGWFWRNRDSADVTVTLQLRGDYSEITRTN